MTDAAVRSTAAACPAPPASPWHGRVARITALRDETPEIRTYVLAHRDAGPRLRFEPGQFHMLLLPGIGEAAISISSDPEDPTAIEHTIHALGNVTLALARLDVGGEVVLRGPFGRGWPLADLRGRDVVIAAGGLGLASLRAALLQLARHRADYGRVVLLHGGRSPEVLLYRDDYDAWRAAGIEVLTIVDRPAPGWTGRTGFVPALLADLPLDPTQTSLLCCGPEVMMKAVVTTAVSRGVAPSDILLSVERNMACAAGFCGLCQFGPAFVCKDGPVFRYPAIAPFLAVPHL